MNFKELKKSLKEKSEKMYLLYGEEVYMRDLLADSVIKTLEDAEFKEFNTLLLNSEKLTITAVSEFFEAYPVMAERKLLILKDTGLFTLKGGDKEQWLKLFSDVPDYVHVLFWESEADKRSKLYKYVDKNGVTCEFRFLERSDLKGMVTKKLSSAKKDMSARDVEMFLDRCAPDLTAIRAHMEKLIAYAGERETITSEDIEKLVAPPLSNRVYDISEAALSGNGEYALKLLSDLKKSGESGVRILAVLSGFFSDLYRAYSISKENMAYKDMLDVMNLPPSRKFVADKMFKRVKSVNPELIRSCLEDCVRAENDVKNGFASEWQSLEMIVLKILTDKRAKKA